MLRFLSVSLSLLLIAPLYGFGQDIQLTATNAAYIGTYKSAKISYGRIYQLRRDMVKVNTVHYMAGIYFRVVANMFEILGNVR